MVSPQHDAIIDITPFNTFVRTLTPQARHWIESHVMLGQACTWVDGILEVSLVDSVDLITAMLTANLKVVQAGGRMTVSCAHLATGSFGSLEPSISPH